DFSYNPLQASNITPDNFSGCVPLTVTFSSSTLNPQPYHVKWIFEDGDTSDLENPVYTFDSVGTYPVRYVIDNGICTDTLTAIITVFENPFADFDYINT